MALKSQEYTTPGDYTWNVPAGVSCVWVTAVAGGGGGAGGGTQGSRGGAGGGGAGEMCEGVPIAVTPLGTLSITVGAGGVGAYWTNDPNWNTPPAGYAHIWPATTGISSGGQGEDTIVGPIRLSGGLGASVHGGAGGGNEANFMEYAESTQGNQGEVWGSGGEPAFNKNCAKFFSGSGGGQGDWYQDWVGGAGGNCGPRSGGAGGGSRGAGGGAASLYGEGGAGAEVESDGATPTAYGAGGGGSGGTDGFTGKTAGSGAGGYVAIFWLA